MIGSFPKTFIELNLGAGKWLHASTYVSVTSRLVVRPTSVSFDNVHVSFDNVHITNLFPPVPLTGSPNVICYHVYVIMHVNDP